MTAGYHYSFRKTRGLIEMPGLIIPVEGRAEEGMVAAFNNEETATYTEIDDHGVHTEANDTKSGSIVVNVQGTSNTGKLIRQLRDIMDTTGRALKGTFKITDLGGTGNLVILTNALLSSNPGLTFGAAQPTEAFRFTGRLRIIGYPQVAVPYGEQNIVPPVI